MYVSIDLMFGLVKLLPQGREFSVIGIDGVELVVKDDVVLRAHVAGGEVEHQSNGGRVRWGNPKIHAKGTARFPAWDRLAVSKGGVQDIYRAPPNMKVV